MNTQQRQINPKIEVDRNGKFKLSPIRQEKIDCETFVLGFYKSIWCTVFSKISQPKINWYVVVDQLNLLNQHLRYVNLDQKKDNMIKSRKTTIFVKIVSIIERWKYYS